MKDRIPTPGLEGRLLITPENGSPAFYARAAMADNPTEQGTPFATATMLTDEVAALFGMDGSAVPNDVLRILSGALVETDGRVTHLDGTLAGVQVAVGTYEGTNTYGASNPNVLTFDFDPKVVFIRSTVGGFGLFVVSSLTSEFEDNAYLSTYNDALGTGNQRNAKYENKFLTWYGTSNATYQLNGKYTFTYVAIG